MLSLLRIRDLGLIRHAELELGPGLVTITGESGSGKSTLLDALSLLSGQARPRLRPAPGAKQGSVEAVFTVSETHGPALRAQLEELGLTMEEEIIVGRRLDASGRSRCFVQGQLVPRAKLTALCELLIERCGQSEAHGLRTTSAQLEALDRFAGLEAEQRKLGQLYRRFREATLEFEALTQRAAENERQRDFLEFQLDELSDVDFSDYASKAARLEELEQVVELQSLCRELQSEVAIGPQSVRARLGWLEQRMGAARVPDEVLASLSALLEQCDQLERVADAWAESDARAGQELAELEEQVRAVDHVASKHRVPPTDLAARQQELRERLASVLEEQERCEQLKHQAEQLQSEVERVAEQLHVKRRKAARRLDRRVNAEFPSVGLEGAEFRSTIDRRELGASGITHYEIGFSANAGSPCAPLGRVASGGELSRVLLCLRLAAHSEADLLTFDEIDAGLGGRTLERVGQALERVARSGQVLCVTHWPQVASLATTHVAVSKWQDQEETRSEITVLDEAGRVEELSRMLGGQHQTASSHARQLRDPTSKRSRAA